MAVTGYITDIEIINADDLAMTRQVMKDLKCDVVYTESTSLSTERPRLKYILEEAQIGDTIVFHKLSNALANTVELTNLCRLCTKENIRIVSVFDHIDSQGTFYHTSQTELFRLLSTFSQESYSSKHKLKKLKDAPVSVRKIERQRNQDKRDVEIINMYMAEYTYEEIMQSLHIGSTRTIFKVLEKYDIPRSRQKYSRLQDIQHTAESHLL